MVAKDFLGALITSIVCFSLGYFFAYLLGTNTLIELGPSNILVQLWEMSTELLGGLAIQATCGMPCAFSIFIPIAAVLIALLNRIVRSNRAILWMASVLLSFLLGMAIYIPIQFFLILAAAI